MTTVFDVFREEPLSYLTIDRGGVYGNRIVGKKAIYGIFKDREGRTSLSNQELYESSATVHVHPKDFNRVSEIVGNGIRRGDKDYAIIGMTEGRNFDDGSIEHLTLTLERAEYVSESEVLES